MTNSSIICFKGEVLMPKVYFKIIVCSLGLTALTGCSSLPDLTALNPFSKELDETKPPELNIDYYNEEAEREAQSSDENTAEIALTEMIEQTETQVKEWQQMKPALTRLVELEADLSFILAQLNTETSSPGFALQDKQYQFNVESKAEDEQSTDALTSLSELFPENSNSPSFSKQSGTVQLKGISPDANPSRLTQEDSGVQADKFSGAGAPLSNQRITADNAQVSAAKFSNLNRVSQFEPNESACGFPELGKGYSMHIASFKSKVSAEKTLRELQTQIASSQECQYPAVIETVNVNGQIFFSARLGAFETRANATQACSSVRQRQDYCGVAPYSGTPLS